MKVLSKLSWRLACILTLSVLIGLVGCTTTEVPVGAAPGNPPGETPPMGNNSQGNPPGGNVSSGAVSNNATGGPLTSGTPYEPYPMPQPNMPAGILGFVPSDGAQVCTTPRVALILHLTDAMRKNEVFDISTITLTLDGKDILPEIQIIAPMIYPQNQATLTYVPSTPLGLGAHQVKFTYPSPSGMITLTWNFTVAIIPCQ